MYVNVYMSYTLDCFRTEIFVYLSCVFDYLSCVCIDNL